MSAPKPVTASPVPETYAAWRRCIEVDCGIELTPAFIAARLQALADERDPHTRRFVAPWGEAQRRRVLGWLDEARAGFAAPS
jgi:hypothetical protein